MSSAPEDQPAEALGREEALPGDCGHDTAGRGESRSPAAGVRFLRVGGLGRDSPHADHVRRAEPAGEVSDPAGNAAGVAVRGLQALQRRPVPQLSALLLCGADGEYIHLGVTGRDAYKLQLALRCWLLVEAQYVYAQSFFIAFTSEKLCCVCLK